MKVVVLSQSGLLITIIILYIYVIDLHGARHNPAVETTHERLNIETRFHSPTAISINPNQQLDYIKQEILASISNPMTIKQIMVVEVYFSLSFSKPG